MTDNNTILVLLAHPDDESFGMGGTMALHAANGASVVLVCATRGEMGEISDPALATPDTLPQVRETELRCACESLGVAAPIFLDYRDSGMDGTPANNDPRAFMNQPAGQVVPRLIALIRDLRPQVVITFDPDGGYGHPDHIAIHRHAVAAFHAAGDAAQYPALGPTWQPARLLYGVFPRSFFPRMMQRMEELGITTDDFADIEPHEMGWPDDQIHFAVDVSQTVEAKWAALECHRTQFGGDNIFNKVPLEESKRMMSEEYFVQAWPEIAPNGRLPDILAGL